MGILEGVKWQTSRAAYKGPNSSAMLMCVNHSLSKVNDYQFLFLSIIHFGMFFVKTSVVPCKGI